MAKIKMKRTTNSVDWAWGYLMIAPTMIGLFILNIFPIFQTIYLSFTKSETFGKVKFVGMQNYQKMLNDELVIKAFMNTFKYTLITALCHINVNIIFLMII